MTVCDVVFLGTVVADGGAVAGEVVLVVNGPPPVALDEAPFGGNCVD